MIVGSLEVHLRMDGCFSLKDKRRIVRHLTESLRHDLGLASAEVGDQELWNVATLGFASVANNRAQAERVLRRAQEIIESHSEVVLEGSYLQLHACS